MIQQTEIYKLAQMGLSTGFIQKMGPETGHHPGFAFPHLLTGAATDAVVLELGHGEALLSVTHFATPFVDEPFNYGRIASAHSLNRIYALGGEPVLATATLGWPSDQLPTEAAEQVAEGSRSLCAEAGVLLASIHRIKSPEIYFGLTVTGKVRLHHLKQTSTATEGCCLYLTKPLGLGILTTAMQQDLLSPEQTELALEHLTHLNTFGIFLGKLPYVKAVAPVGSTGLLGALTHLAESSGLSADIDFHNVPVWPDLDSYLSPAALSSRAQSTWNSLATKINEVPDEQQRILADPQPNGGLLIAVDSRSATEFEQVAFEHKLYLKAFGQLIEQQEKVVYVR
ncbi:selenide, water dikinase SelD [Larkinella bovis]|uniref:Selenide, water dikinase SelD n=1 Tax=Larkinella bovis TaxID=683041 RepID=A0ABW0I6E0_9BACT